MGSNIFLKQPEPHLLWTDIHNGGETYFTVLLYDCLNYRISHLGGGKEYVVFKAELWKGFEDMNLDLNLKFNLHFPKRCFEIAWERAKNFRLMKLKDKIDCAITFIKVTRKRMDIIKREYQTVGEYNSKEFKKEFLSKSYQQEQVKFGGN